MSGERHRESKVSYPRTQRNDPGQGSNQDCSSRSPLCNYHYSRSLCLPPFFEPYYCCFVKLQDCILDSWTSINSLLGHISSNNKTTNNHPKKKPLSKAFVKAWLFDLEILISVLFQRPDIFLLYIEYSNKSTSWLVFSCLYLFHRMKELLLMIWKSTWMWRWKLMNQNRRSCNLHPLHLPLRIQVR